MNTLPTKATCTFTLKNDSVRIRWSPKQSCVLVVCVGVRYLVEVSTSTSACVRQSVQLPPPAVSTQHLTSCDTMCLGVNARIALDVAVVPTQCSYHYQRGDTKTHI